MNVLAESSTTPTPEAVSDRSSTTTPTPEAVSIDRSEDGGVRVL